VGGRVETPQPVCRKNSNKAEEFKKVNFVKPYSKYDVYGSPPDWLMLCTVIATGILILTFVLIFGLEAIK
jgi:hypothetical protein